MKYINIFFNKTNIENIRLLQSSVILKITRVLKRKVWA